jgi:hypothetical protein
MRVLHASNHEWLPAPAFRKGDGLELEGCASGVAGSHPASGFALSIPARPRGEA